MCSRKFSRNFSRTFSRNFSRTFSRNFHATLSSPKRHLLRPPHAPIFLVYPRGPLEPVGGPWAPEEGPWASWSRTPPRMRSVPCLSLDVFRLGIPHSLSLGFGLGPWFWAVRLGRVGARGLGIVNGALHRKLHGGVHEWLRWGERRGDTG